VIHVVEHVQVRVLAVEHAIQRAPFSVNSTPAAASALVMSAIVPSLS
jgi:hypothetical protein